MGCFFTNSSFESIYNTFLYMLPCYFLKSSIYTGKISSKILLYQQCSCSRLSTYSAKLPQYVIYYGISLARFEKKLEKIISILSLKWCMKKTWFQKRECCAWEVVGAHLSMWISQFHLLHFWFLSTNEYMWTTLRTMLSVLLSKQFHTFRAHYESLPSYRTRLKKIPWLYFMQLSSWYGMTLQVCRFPSQEHRPYRSSVFYFCHRGQQLSSDAMQ